MNEFKIILDLPGKALNPNSRSHWGARAKASKSQREDACFASRISLRDMRKEILANELSVSSEWERVFVQPVFFFKDRRKRDRDNCSASLKAARDGICDAMKKYGYVEDDDSFVPMPPVLELDKHLPRVEITVSRFLD
jgi:Holliday junction resolvase RusA-like endonuclease